jgi:integrase
MGVRLSVAAIERLKPHPTKRLEIPDAGKPGLYLVIQPSGRKSWAVRYRVRGESRKLTLNGFPRVEVARKLAQAALDAAAAGGDPARANKLERTAPSHRIDDLFAEFMAKHVRRRDGKPIRESSKDETARLLGLKRTPSGSWATRSPRVGALARWSGRDVRSITKRDVLDLLDWRVESGARVGANRTLAALKTFFSWCIKRDILSSSPCDRVDDPSPEISMDRSLSDAEIAAIWRAAERIGYPYGGLVQLLLLTGQRRDEVREAVAAEFDLKAALWKIPSARTKNGREHHVPLSDMAAAIFVTLPKIESDAEWLFTIGGEAAFSNLSRWKRRLDALMLEDLRKSDESAELKPWRLHDLRHTLKTWMQQARIPEDVRNAVQNHYDGDMDELYGHYSFEKEKRDALTAWAQHIANLIALTARNVLVVGTIGRPP